MPPPEAVLSLTKDLTFHDKPLDRHSADKSDERSRSYLPFNGFMETVYIETTILSYLLSRPSRDIIVAARQELTREWWDHARPGYDCVISQIVIDEIAAGDPVHAAKRLELASTLSALAVNQACLNPARQYLDRGYIPKGEVRDALHIAVAVVWKVDYPFTWNCKHIANAHSLRQLRKFSENQGHEFPHVCTPEEL